MGRWGFAPRYCVAFTRGLKATLFVGFTRFSHHSSRLEVGSWKLEVGSWKLGLKFIWKLETEIYLEIVGWKFGLAGGGRQALSGVPRLRDRDDEGRGI